MNRDEQRPERCGEGERMGKQKCMRVPAFTGDLNADNKMKINTKSRILLVRIGRKKKYIYMYIHGEKKPSPFSADDWRKTNDKR